MPLAQHRARRGHWPLSSVLLLTAGLWFSNNLPHLDLMQEEIERKLHIGQVAAHQASQLAGYGIEQAAGVIASRA